VTAHSYHSCNDEECKVCPGGLALCDVCNGGEGELLPECPGRRLTVEELGRCYDAMNDTRKQTVLLFEFRRS
jgi:hypothetical protein